LETSRHGTGVGGRERSFIDNQITLNRAADGCISHQTEEREREREKREKDQLKV